MKWIRLIPLLLVSLVACQSHQTTQSTYIAFTGATILDGTGTNPLTDGVLLIRKGRIVAVGTRDQVTIPKNTQVRNVSGKTIIPGLINAHGHVGDVKGIEPGHYSAENVQDNLAIYARYGITTVVSLGGDKEEAVALRAVQDTNTHGRARLYIAGEVINGNTPQEAVAVVDKNHTMGVDFMKIRVDDNVGTSPKMPEDVYRAVIARSHELGYKIATHMYYLDDAKKLLEAGTDLLAHSVRDLPVDDEFIRLIKERNIGYCPTLTRELSTFVYEDTAVFFTDPFFTKEYDPATISPLKDPASQQKIQNNPVAQTYKRQLPVAMQNLKTLSAQGVPIVFGTDSGMPARFMGYFEHLEMQMMAEAGLTPQQIIESATKNAATYMGLKEVGTLTPGYWADFLVLDADPLADIANIRKIASIYIGGTEVKAK